MSRRKSIARFILAGLGLLPASRRLRARIQQSEHIHGLRMFVHFAANGIHIRRFDRKVTRASALWDNGYICYPKAPAEILSAARHFKADGKIVIDEATLPVIAYLVNLVRRDVFAYLGANARIDNICLTVVPASAETFKSVSSSWHTDNVGHRLKLFFCIEGYGDVPTCYRAGSNRRPYRPSVRELPRFSGHFDFTSGKNEVRLNHATGDITLFDTNGQHRGGYERNHHARRILLIEFADREKSDHFAARTAIGPGNTSCRVFSIARSIADARVAELMLDPALLVPETEEIYRYDWPARNSGTEE